jgi:hypothetical protein
MADVTTTLRKWLEVFTAHKHETPDFVVLGWGDYDYRKEDWPEWDRWGLVTPLDQIPDKILDRKFDTGFGGNESPNLCAWSPSWVLFSDDYDGAESLCWVPRAPVDHEPVRPGGG